MGFEDTKKAKAVDKDFIVPETCRCGKPSHVAIAEVVNKNTGGMRSGAASEFCGRDNSGNPNWILQDWWELTKYEGYCADCWAGHTKPGKQKYNEDQIRGAWRWLMGEISITAKGDALLGTFPKITLSNDQRDLAIEIVNYEAHRTNQPDAIPDEYKMAEVWV